MATHPLLLFSNIFPEAGNEDVFFLLKVKLRLFYKLWKMERKPHNMCAATQQGRLHRAVFL